LNGGLYFMHSQYMGSNASTQQSLGFQLGGQYAISQHWSANFSSGLRRTDIQSNPTGGTSSASNSSSMSPLGNVGVTYKDNLSMFSIGYSKTIMPSALGQTLQSQSILTKYSYKLTPHLLLSINNVVLQSESLGSQSTPGTTASFGRDAITNTVTFAWEFAEKWQLKGSYMYRWQKVQGEASAESNMVMISLNYALDEIDELETGKYKIFDNTNADNGSNENRGQWFQ